MNTCPSCADAAALRRAFTQASERYGHIREGRVAKLSKNWQPSADDIADMNAWRQMYEAVRDTTAGLRLLQELATLTAECDRLRAENAELVKAQSTITSPP